MSTCQAGHSAYVAIPDADRYAILLEPVDNSKHSPNKNLVLDLACMQGIKYTPTFRLYKHGRRVGHVCGFPVLCQLACASSHNIELGSGCRLMSLWAPMHRGSTIMSGSGLTANQTIRTISDVGSFSFSFSSSSSVQSRASRSARLASAQSVLHWRPCLLLCHYPMQVLACLLLPSHGLCCCPEGSSWACPSWC